MPNANHIKPQNLTKVSHLGSIKLTAEALTRVLNNCPPGHSKCTLVGTELCWSPAPSEFFDELIQNTPVDDVVILSGWASTQKKTRCSSQIKPLEFGYIIAGFYDPGGLTHRGFTLSTLISLVATTKRHAYAIAQSNYISKIVKLSCIISLYTIYKR